MKSLYQYAYLLGLCLILSACHNRQTNANEQIKEITFGENIDSTNAADLLECKFMPLATSDSYIIGSIEYCIEADNNVILSDSQTEEVYCFSKTGQFIAKIGQRGEGPDEYISPTSIFYDKANGLIGIEDSDKEAILYFNYSDFSFNHSVDISQLSVSGCVLVDNYLVWRNRHYDSASAGFFATSTLNGKKIAEMAERKFSSGYITGSSYPVYTYNNEAYGYEPYDDMTIYRIDSVSAAPTWTAHIAEQSLPPTTWIKKISENGQKFFYPDLVQSDYVSFYEISENENSIKLYYIVKGNRFISFYDKRNDKAITFSQSKLIDDLGIGHLNYFLPGTINNCYVGVINPGDIDCDATDLTPTLGKLIGPDSADDNPILCFIALK